jgi:hypothetical protein
MASTKSVATTRRSGSGKSSRKNAEPEISPARWAGVALVIAAIIGAIALAVISPSDQDSPALPGVVGTGASPSPAAVVLDTRVPTAQPRITSPVEGVTAEIEIPVTVDVPAEDDVPRRFLTLVIMRGEDALGEVLRPKTGGKITVQGVRLETGVNELQAVLVGAGGGLGPMSDPVAVTLDRDAPVLAVTSPRNKATTFDDAIGVSGTSEPGAEVLVRNVATKYATRIVVGPSGTFDVKAPLKKGPNRIVVASTDNAGMLQEKTVRVTRKDGRPFIELTAPKRIKASTLPRTIRVVVDVTDEDKKPMQGAVVSYTLGGPGRTSVDHEDETNAKGRSVWNVEVTPASSPADSILAGVVVTSPHGDTQTRRLEIDIT